MKSDSTPRQRMVIAQGAALVALLSLLGTGCQTFSLTEEQFALQQQGKQADPETGAVVGAAGTLGYYGAMIGAIVAGWK